MGKLNKHLCILGLFLFSNITFVGAETVTLRCDSLPDSYFTGPSFDLKFVNDIDDVEQAEACFQSCRKGQKKPTIWTVERKTDYGMKLLVPSFSKLPEDGRYYYFDFDTLELSRAAYQMPWLGTEEEWKAMGLIGKPSKDWKRIGEVKYGCKKKRVKIIE